MSAYNGRRGPNVSQYLRDLNTKPQQQEADADESLEFDSDLTIFTNSHFFDFDAAQSTDFQPTGQQSAAVDPTAGAGAASADGSATPTASSPDALNSATVMGDLSGLDFMSSDFNFTDFTYASPTLATFPDALGNLQPLQPNPAPAVYAPAAPQQQSQFAQPIPRTGEKRKSDASIRPLSLEEQSRLAAEEDKRRRNTAASARFRIKKKQREQALEKSAKEMTEKVTVLEGRISQLETENKWLKNLIMEKNGSKEDIATMLRDLASKRPELGDDYPDSDDLKMES